MSPDFPAYYSFLLDYNSNFMDFVTIKKSICTTVGFYHVETEKERELHKKIKAQFEQLCQFHRSFSQQNVWVKEDLLAQKRELADWEITIALEPPALTQKIKELRPQAFPKNDFYHLLESGPQLKKYHQPIDSPSELIAMLKRCWFFEPASKLLAATFNSAPRYEGWTIQEPLCLLGQMCTLIALQKPHNQYITELQQLEEMYPSVNKLSHLQKVSLKGIFAIFSKPSELKDRSRQSREIENLVLHHFFESEAGGKLYLSNYYAVQIPTQKELFEDYHFPVFEIANNDFIIFFHRPYEEGDTQVFEQEPFNRFAKFKKRLKIPGTIAEFKKEMAAKLREESLALSNPLLSPSPVSHEYRMALEALELGDRAIIGRSRNEKALKQAHDTTVDTLSRAETLAIEANQELDETLTRVEALTVEENWRLGNSGTRAETRAIEANPIFVDPFNRDETRAIEANPSPVNIPVRAEVDDTHTRAEALVSNTYFLSWPPI